MLDEILDLFQRGKRQRGANRSTPDRESGLPFDLPFLGQDDEDDDHDRRQDQGGRRPDRRSPSERAATDGDWF